jgi:hypothetical protein
VSPLSAAAIGLASAVRADELAERASTAPVGAVLVDNPRARAADAVIGFPQSMQNRDDASFSRPQNVQVASELTSAGVGHAGRIYGNRLLSGQRGTRVMGGEWGVGSKGVLARRLP